jgi:hypothetical protein
VAELQHGRVSCVGAEPLESLLDDGDGGGDDGRGLLGVTGELFTVER